MRRLVVGFLAVVVLGVSGAIALAQSDKHASAELTALAASGISGKVDLQEMQQGGTNVVLRIRDLQPGEEYVSVFFGATICGADATTPTNLVASFRANPSGNATVNVKLDRSLDEIGSIAVRPTIGATNLACASFAP